jgi:hypothetical protein
MEKQFFKTDLDQKFAQLDEVANYLTDLNNVLQTMNYYSLHSNPHSENGMDAMMHQFSFKENLETFLSTIPALKECLYEIYNFEMNNKK